MGRHPESAPSARRPFETISGCLLIFCLVAFGCATWAPGPQEPTSGMVFAEIEATVVAGDLDRAYLELASFRERFPEAEEDRKAFRLAADVYRKLYFRDRYREPDAIWVRETPTWLFRWFESFLVESGPDAFPQDDADVLFLGHHYGFVRQFQAWAASSETLARWDLSFEKDNGRILAVTGTPRIRADES